MVGTAVFPGQAPWASRPGLPFAFVSRHYADAAARTLRERMGHYVVVVELGDYWYADIRPVPRKPVDTEPEV